MQFVELLPPVPQLDETLRGMSIEDGLNYAVNVLKSARLAVELCRWHLTRQSGLSHLDRESLLFLRWSLMIGSPQLSFYYECLCELDSYLKSLNSVPIQLFELRLLSAMIPAWVTLANVSSVPANISFDPATITRQSLINRSLLQLHEMQSDPSLSKEQRDQVLLSLARVLINIQDYYNAHKILHDKILSSTPTADSNLVRKDGGIAVLSQMGRMFVQMGSMPKAKQCFERVEYLLSTQYSPSNSAQDLTKQGQNLKIPISETARHDCVMLNRAVLSIGMGDWASAVTILSTLIAANPSNNVGLNNLSLALLYTGKMQESVALLESMVYNNESGSAIDRHILFNLLTLYDLAPETSTAVSKQRIISKQKPVY